MSDVECLVILQSMFVISCALTYAGNVLSSTIPRVSTLCITDATTHDQISQAFHCSVLAYCLWSNTGGGNGWEPG